MSKRKRRILWIAVICIVFVGVVLLRSLFFDYENLNYTPPKEFPGQAGMKPVIYLYPEKEMEVSVKLEYGGILTCTFPDYDEGWTVIARPDGTLMNTADDKIYSYLFWEGFDYNEYDFSSGFVVPGEETAEFLQDKLSYLGLTPREYNEMIVFWLPKMQENAYNLIAFQQEEYTDLARLTITPEPDSLLRVFMTYIPLEEAMEVPEQKLETFERKGFTVVEWGGSEIVKE